MASKKTIPYSFKSPFNMVGVASSILNLNHKTDTREEDREERREPELKERMKDEN